MDLIENLWNRITARDRDCFFGALAAGLLTHLYALTNKLPNWDDISNIDRPGAMNDFGRWFLRFVQPWVSSYSVPALKGAVTILLLALTAVMVCRALRLRSAAAAFLVGITMVTFPAVTSGMLFMFTIASYAVAVLMTGAAVWSTLRFRFGWIPGALLLCLSLGIYQAYLPFAVALFLIAIQLMLLRGAALRPILAAAFHELLALCFALAGYLVMLRRYQLSDYRGINSVGETAPAEMLEAFLRAYHRILEFFLTKPMSYTSDFQRILNALVILGVCCMTAFLFVRGGLHRKPLIAFLFGLTVFLTPLGMSLVYVMAPEVTHASTLMIFSYMTVYFLAAALAEELTAEEKGQGGADHRNVGQSGTGKDKTIRGRSAARMGSALMAVLIFCIACSNYKMANEAYFRTGMAMTRVENFYERILVRLEVEGGWDYGKTYAVLGDYWPEKNILSSFDLMEGRFEDLEGLAIENGLFTSGVRHDFIRSYMGIDAPYAASEQCETIMASDAYAQMAAYPGEGCVREIDGVWVVKIR